MWYSALIWCILFRHAHLVETCSFGWDFWLMFLSLARNETPSSQPSLNLINSRSPVWSNYLLKYVVYIPAIVIPAALFLSLSLSLESLSLLLCLLCTCLAFILLNCDKKKSSHFVIILSRGCTRPQFLQMYTNQPPQQWACLSCHHSTTPYIHTRHCPSCHIN